MLTFLHVKELYECMVKKIEDSWWPGYDSAFDVIADYYNISRKIAHTETRHLDPLSAGKERVVAPLPVAALPPHG